MSYHGKFGPATKSQRKTLQELGLGTDEYMTFEEAHQLISARIEDWRKLPATLDQERFLRRRGRWRNDLRRGGASDLIEELMAVPASVEESKPYMPREEYERLKRKFIERFRKQKGIDPDRPA
jgi:hypothetical protein